MSGDDTISALLLRQENLIQLLKQGGFELKKWSSNCGEALIRIPQEDQAVHSTFDPKDDMSIKILGLHWDPLHDTFGYHTSTVPKTITKRVVLSTIAKLYDPIGALAPITFWAKSFMQLIWKSGINWDDSLSPMLINSWVKFSLELSLVSQVKIPRYILTFQSSIQLIGFCDAPEKGYASVVYLRTIDIHGHISVHFITSKSKVAPLKFGKLETSLPIPRLELCSALLLAQTIHQLLITFKNDLPITSIYAWTDSQVVLSWITSSPSQFKIFVTNRLAKISTLLPNCQWNYIPSASNPADCVSRGLFPSQAIGHTLYWQGPTFLLQSESGWSKIPYDLIPLSQLPDFKKLDMRVCNVTSLEEHEWFNRFSSLTQLQRVIAYVLRFIQRTKRLNMSTDSLNRIELIQALIPIIISIQLAYFKDLLMELRSKEPTISPRSLAQLAPFIDSTGIIRVGGCLRNSNVSFSVQCPILLPKSSHFTQLVIRHYHLTYFHAGPQITAPLIARSYQILTFEELSTLASRIEAILNSQPITALSTDPNDFRSLSPGDFLIGEPLVAIPEPDIKNISINRLNRWELLR